MELEIAGACRLPKKSCAFSDEVGSGKGNAGEGAIGSMGEAKMGSPAFANSAPVRRVGAMMTQVVTPVEATNDSQPRELLELEEGTEELLRFELRRLREKKDLTVLLLLRVAGEAG